MSQTGPREWLSVVAVLGQGAGRDQAGNRKGAGREQAGNRQGTGKGAKSHNILEMPESFLLGGTRESQALPESRGHSPGIFPAEKGYEWEWERRGQGQEPAEWELQRFLSALKSRDCLEAGERTANRGG